MVVDDDGNPYDDGYDDGNPSDDDDGNPLDNDDGNPLDDNDVLVDDDGPTVKEDDQTDDYDYEHDDGGHSNTDYPSDDDEPSADFLNCGYSNGYDDAGYGDGYNNTGYDDYGYGYDYDDNGYYNDEGYHSNSHHKDGYDATGLNKIVEELENDIQLLWDTFSSLSTNHTFVGHRLD